MKATLWVTLIGALYGIPQLIGLLRPELWARWLRAFPRSKLWGWILMPWATIWFLYLLNQNAVSDFAPYKTVLLGAFGVIGFGTCFFVQDFLAVRGLAILVLLVAYYVLTAIQWLDTQWRLVVTVWMYVNVVLAIWITISPWRLRDYIEWNTRTMRRLRVGSAIRFVFGLIVMVIGLTAIRAAELAK